MAGGVSQGKPGSPQITSEEHPTIKGEPENEQRRLREKAHDKTLADSFPTSDPPSSIPDPCTEDSDAA
jgi:hypothetical protein